MTSSGTSHGPRRRPREATSTTPCRSGTTIGPNSARTGAVHRSSAQSRPTGPRAVRAHPSPAGTAATGATHHDRRRKINDGVRRRRRARAAGAPPLLPASRRGGRPPCKQHGRLVSPSPRPAASSRTSPSILYASTAHRGVAVTSRGRATAPPMRVAEVSSPAIVTRDRPVRLSIARLHLPARPALGLPLQLVRMVLGAVPDHSQQSLLRRARLLGARKTNALNALTRPRSTGRRMSQTTSLEGEHQAA